MSTIGVIDYGAGNIGSVMNAIDYAGGDVERVSDPDKLKIYDKLVLPGVGAAGQAINQLRLSGMEDAIHEVVGKVGTPMMGICVGMQILAETLYEYGTHKGLGFIKGEVYALEDLGIKEKPIPHMGWNDVTFSENISDLAKQLGSYKSFYFAHSFAMKCDEDMISSEVSYDGLQLTSSVLTENIVAFQFHPEKSQVSGDILIQWFLDWQP